MTWLFSYATIRRFHLQFFTLVVILLVERGDSRRYEKPPECEPFPYVPGRLNSLRRTMTALSEKEIVAGLNKLGIHSGSEIDCFLKEYIEYCSTEGHMQLRRSYLKSKLRQRTFSKRFHQACYFATAILNTILSISKVNIHNQGKR